MLVMSDVAGFIEWMGKINNIHQADEQAMGRAIEKFTLPEESE